MEPPTRSTVMMLSISLIGLSLRIFQIGVDSFWIDEVGVILVAQEKSPLGMLLSIRQHIMAMPLDYLITWILLRVSSNEAWLRLPEAIWGTAALVVTYHLFKKVYSNRVGLIVSFLLAISPIHIQYSQELRFYAPLSFFFVLTNLLLIRACEENTKRRWFVYIITMMVGILFHVYVFFSLIYGFCLTLLQKPHGNATAKKYFLQSTIFILCGFLICIIIFGSVNPYRVPFSLLEPSLTSTIAVGLGWVPFYSPQVFDPSWIWGILCLLFEIIGIMVVIRHSKARLFFIATVIQIGLVLLSHWGKGYFLSPRHLLFLLPNMLFFAAVGVDCLCSKAGIAIMARKELKRNSRASGFLLATWLSIVTLSVVPALVAYYQADKGSVREICSLLHQYWQPGVPIWIIPGHEKSQFQYYLNEWEHRPDIAQSIRESTSDEAGDKDLFNTSQVWVITDAQSSLGLHDHLNTNGFHEVFQSKQIERYFHQVWYKSSGSERTMIPDQP